MLLEYSWAPLGFALHIVKKLLCFWLCLYDAIVELHAMDEKMFNDFIIGNDNDFVGMLYTIKVYLN